MKRRYSILLMFAAAVFFYSECHAGEITVPPEGYDSFYKKYLDCDGIPVISSEKVDDRAFYRLRLLLDKVLENRPDVKQALIDEGFKYIIIAQEEEVTDVPEYAYMEPKDYWNKRARGFGGKTTSCGEENLLMLPGDRYFNESIFIHELAHGVHLTGLVKCEPGFQAELDRLYKSAIDKGLYKEDYAATNAEEYWAESFQAFYDCDAENNFVHNHVNTREELIEYDKDISDFIAKVMRINKDNDWRYYTLIDANTIETAPAELSQNGQFTRYIWCAGFPILGTSDVNNDEMLLINNLIRNLFYYRQDILEKMTAAGYAIMISSHDDDNIISKDGNHIKIKAGTLLSTNETLNGNPGKVIYELAMSGADCIEDKGFMEKLKITFDNNKEKWSENSQRNLSNEKIYFATGVQLYFDAGTILNVNSREKLKEFDPELAKLVEQVFKYPNKKKWRLCNSR